MDLPLDKLPVPKYDKKTMASKPVIEVKFVDKLDNLASKDFLKIYFS